MCAYESLPVPKHPNQSKKKPKPGWTEHVRPYRENSLFWHSIWKSAGRPMNTVLHQIMKKTRNLYHYQLKKVKKNEDIIKKNKLLDACVNGNGDIFSEIKKIRSHKNVVASSMDGQNDDIAGHFKGLYSDLYNSVDDLDNLRELKAEVDNEINFSQLFEVDKVTPDVVQKAASNLKDSKSDPIYSFSSDCLKHGPDKLYDLLSVAIRSYLVHGHITTFLLLATLLPIIKDKLASISSSKNYRSIAISSLILKIIDWVILTLYGVTLGLDELQFAYQAGCSTTMCTWMVLETISYFMRNGSDVFTCCMDMTKAFDLVQHSLLFRKLLLAGLPVIFVRLLLVIYLHQYANVKWNNSFSDMFSLSNGVRQGGVLSAILYCLYVDNLFKELRRSGYGCWVNGNYHGILGYSDDNMLIAPSRHALQSMLNICENYAAEHNLKFSTDANPNKCKTKCIAFQKKPQPLEPLNLCGNPLPWVATFKHLGNTIVNSPNFASQDVKIKRAQYVTKNIELNQEFYFSNSETKFKINQIYNSHYTGSPLWDIFSHEVKQFEGSYNKSIKIMFDLPLDTHRNLIEPISGTSHVKIVLQKRFLSFIDQILKSKKRLPKLMLNVINVIKDDIRSTTGKNLRGILLQTNKLNVNQLTVSDSQQLNYHPIDENQKWKIKVIKEVLSTRNEELTVDGFSSMELEEILFHLCSG